MATKIILLLTLFAGMALVWLLMLVATYGWQRCSPCYQPKQQEKLFIVVPSWRWLALIVATLAVFFPFMFFAMWPVEGVVGSDYLVIGFVGVMTGGLFGFSVYQLWMMRCYFNEQGVWGVNALGFPHYIAWADVQRLTFSVTLQSYQLQGVGWPVYLSRQLDEQDELTYTLWRYLPAEVIQTPLSTSSREKAERDALILLDDPSQGYRSAPNFYQHAGKIAVMASIPCLVSWFSVAPALLSTLFAGVMGLFFMLPAYALLLSPRMSHSILNKIDVGGRFVWIVLVQIGTRLHLNLLGGEAQLTAPQILASVIQTISLSFLIPALGLVMIRRYGQ